MMRRLRGRTPSPALLVAIAALCVALVGTAVAGPVAGTSRLSKADRKVVVKTARTLALRYIKRFTPPLANREITQRAPFLSVNVAEEATRATTANRAKTAESADTAEIAEGVREGSITGTELADNSVTGAKIGPDQVTGINVDEQSLGKVPSAFNADNAAFLGGVPSSGYVEKIFARVEYNNSTPSLLAASPGVFPDGEKELGYPRLTFPKTMASCAVGGIVSVGGGGQAILRESTSGAEVVFAITDHEGNPVRSDFDVIAVC